MYSMEKNYLFSKQLICWLLVLATYKVNGQQYADRSFYLIDSLDLKVLTTKEKEGLTYNLKKFHATKANSAKVNILLDCIYKISSIELRCRYANWTLEFMDSILTQEFTSEKRRFFFQMNKAAILYAKGDFLNLLGEQDSAFYYTNKSLKYSDEIGARKLKPAQLHLLAKLHRSRMEFDKCITALKEGQSLVNEFNDVKGQANYCLALGQVHFAKRELYKSEKNFFKAIHLGKKLHDYGLVAICYNELGLLYKIKNESVKSIEYFQMALEIYEGAEDRMNQAVTLGNIGTLFLDIHELAKSKDYLLRALKVHEDLKYNKGIVSVLENLSACSIIEKDYDKALAYQLRNLKMLERIEQPEKMMETLFQLGLIYYKKGDYVIAEPYLRKCMYMAEKYNNSSEIINCSLNLGNILYDRGDKIGGEKYLIYAYKEAQKLGKLELIARSANYLSQFYRNTNRPVKAWDLQALYIKLKDSLVNTDIQKKLLIKNSKYELESKQRELKLLDAKMEVQELVLAKRNITIAYSLVGLVLAIILVVIALLAYKRKKRLNKCLNQKYDEKVLLLKEIHHRVKNNLSVVNGLLTLHSKDVNDENILEVFKEAQNRVIAMALLHERMYMSDNLKYIDVREHVEILAQELIANYSLSETIELETRIDENNINLRTMVPLGLLINEFISNSLKHAFVGRDQGKICICLKKIYENYFELILRDDGVGIVKNDNAPNSLGVKLISLFVNQLQGTIEKNINNGTQLTIKFKSYES